MKKEQVLPSLLLLLLFTLFIAFRAEAKDPSRIKIQTEAGFNLTTAAAQRILKSFPFESEVRQDYYADIYDGQNFLLIPNPQMLKFRLKSTKDKAVLQVNTKSSVTPATCNEAGNKAWNFTIKEKSVGELTLNKNEEQAFARSVIGQASLLQTQQLAPAAAEIKKFHLFVLALPVPLMSKLTAVPNNAHWYFTTSHYSKKTKSTYETDLGFGNIEISITQGDDYVGSTWIQHRDEVEFQMADKMSTADFKQSICQFIKTQNLSLADLAPPDLDIQTETLKLLKPLNTLLDL